MPKKFLAGNVSKLIAEKALFQLRNAIISYPDLPQTSEREISLFSAIPFHKLQIHSAPKLGGKTGNNRNP